MGQIPELPELPDFRAMIEPKIKTELENELLEMFLEEVNSHRIAMGIARQLGEEVIKLRKQLARNNEDPENKLVAN